VNIIKVRDFVMVLMQGSHLQSCDYDTSRRGPGPSLPSPLLPSQPLEVGSFSFPFPPPSLPLEVDLFPFPPLPPLPLEVGPFHSPPSIPPLHPLPLEVGPFPSLLLPSLSLEVGPLKSS